MTTQEMAERIVSLEAALAEIRARQTGLRFRLEDAEGRLSAVEAETRRVDSGARQGPSCEEALLDLFGQMAQAEIVARGGVRL